MTPDDSPREPLLPLILVVLDGWGVAPPHPGNAIASARTPMMDRLRRNPTALLEASGVDVGLPTGQDGNSEAGHLNLGAGRIVTQDAVEISRTINDGRFVKNAGFQTAVEHVRERKSRLHLMGLLANQQSAHADPDHLLALLELIRFLKATKTFLHLFTDGRDSPRFAAAKLIKRIEWAKGTMEIATIVGRYYAMDRAKNWSRTKIAYELLTEGKGIVARSAEDAIWHAYNRNESDEFIAPTIVVPPGRTAAIHDHDAVIFFNLRSDRARQITKAFVQPNFVGFDRAVIPTDLVFVAMTDFGPDLPNVLSAFPSRDIGQTLPMQLADLKQTYLAESEKFAHITYFFNGGYDHPVAGEERVMVASPEVKTFDLAPAMASAELADVVVGKLREGRDFLAVNFAASDMVAHTGNFAATVQAVEAVDAAVARIGEEIASRGGAMLVTGDHGNAEELINVKTGEIDTEHSTNPVPFHLFAPSRRDLRVRRQGRLADVAPTILELLRRTPPPEMTGRSLLKR